MSWEEDYLLAKVRELENRLARVEEVCRITNYSTSTKPQPTNIEASKSSPHPPAQMTDSHSKKDQVESSTATSTAGSGRETLIDDDPELRRLLGK